MSSAKPHFIVLANAYNSSSAGVMCLHNLVPAIKAAGYEATLVLFQAPVANEVFTMSLDGQNWLPVSEYTLRDTFSGLGNPIFIGGENLRASFMKGVKYCRYYLNRIGVLTNVGEVGEREYKIAFNKLYVDDYNFYLPQYTGAISLEEAKALQIGDRQIDLTYVGKGSRYMPQTPTLPESVLITSSWPPTKKQYYYLLGKTRLLYSYDAVTAVCEDAALMGAIPIYMTTAPFKRDEWFSQWEPDQRALFLVENGSVDINIDLFKTNRANLINRLLDFRDGFQNRIAAMTKDVEAFFS